MKKLITAAVTVFLTISSLCANSAYLYTESTTEKVAGGITYEQRNILTDSGWIRAYIAYIDLANPNAAIKVMTSSDGCSYLSTVQQMAYNNNTSIAINGDFFNTGSSQTNMIGMVYKDGELVSTPALDNQVSFALTDTNQVIMDYFSFQATVTSPQGYSCPIYQINKKPVDTGMITMLTSEWSSKTWGAGNMTELVVENDIVTEIRQPGSGAGQMPANGYILTVNPSINGFFNNFKVGDTVTVSVTLNPNITNIKEATGGNTLIVDNGKTAHFTGNIPGNAQRTSVGVTADGKTLLLVATDGRQSDCKGLTQEGLAELMINLGAHKAINLDGGGSTTFIKKDATGNQQTINSVSSLRKVSTAIGVVDKKLTGTHAASGKLTTDKSTVFAGDAINLKAFFYDEYSNDFYVDQSQIRYYDSTGINIENGVYIPAVAGTHTVYAQYGSITVSHNIEVVDSIFAIEIANEDFNMDAGSSANLNVYGYSSRGNRFPISGRCINWTSSNPAVSVSNGTVNCSANESAIITAELNGKSDSVAVNKGISGIKAPLPVHGNDRLYGNLNATATVAITGQVPSGATLLNRFFAQKRLENLNKYSYSYLTDNYYTALQPANSSVVSSFGTRIFGSSAFITYDNSKGSLTTAELTEICKLANGNTPNIVLITKKPAEELGKDGITLKNVLEKSASYGKNIFWVCGGSTTGVRIENGIRYLTAGTVADYRTSSYASDANYCSYILFCINGNEIKYEFVNDMQ